ncbi:hypothetical protein [Rubinisphaera sp. JC750]|uniref:hypothetical protein n=1 Tax=Rubinisphaera sp. JC750 TaxID=2898658 RepID=UPI001F27A7C8|nr:hypothetical protein [Rubinisphaera sp. JC750]
MTAAAATANNSAATPTDPLDVLEDFGDKWNPMVVREVRRMLKSPSFGVSYILLTLACLAAAYLFTLDPSFTSETDDRGSVFCQVFLGLLTIPVMIVVPLSLFSSASQEHTEYTLEMLSVTTLRTEQLIWGFSWCGVAHAGVYFCSLGPYICFGYLLGGVGLFQIIAGILCVASMGIAAGIWGLMLGACSKGPISRNIFGGLSVLGGLGLAVLTMSLNGLFFSPIGESAWEGILCVLAVQVPACFLMFGIARQQLLLNDPYMKPYRVVLDADGNVSHFAHRFNAPYDRVPELHGIQPSVQPAPPIQTTTLKGVEENEVKAE